MKHFRSVYNCFSVLRIQVHIMLEILRQLCLIYMVAAYVLEQSKNSSLTANFFKCLINHWIVQLEIKGVEMQENDCFLKKSVSYMRNGGNNGRDVTGAGFSFSHIIHCAFIVLTLDESDIFHHHETCSDHSYFLAPNKEIYFRHLPIWFVLVVRNDLKMGKGKIAAQCSHATLGLFKKLQQRAPKSLRRWERCGQVKVVVKIESEEDMLVLQGRAKSLNLPTHITIDAGRTQIAPNSRTVMAIL
ncbi:hypothetical protein ACJX0J_041344, partial [Zea mays]